MLTFWTFTQTRVLFIALISSILNTILAVKVGSGRYFLSRIISFKVTFFFGYISPITCVYFNQIQSGWNIPWFCAVFLLNKIYLKVSNEVFLSQINIIQTMDHVQKLSVLLNLSIWLPKHLKALIQCREVFCTCLSGSIYTGLCILVVQKLCWCSWVFLHMTQSWRAFLKPISIL